VNAPGIRRPVLRLASFVFCGSFCAVASAGTGTVTANASVDTFCKVATTALSFGAYDPIVVNQTTSLDNGTTASVTVTCVKGSAPTIALGLGTHANGSIRRMQHASKPAELLTYELYQPPSTAANASCAPTPGPVWGSTGVNLFSPGAAQNKNSRTFNVCGTVLAGQDVEVGTYSDTVVVTVDF
jgi:spore coat protein U-like protein